MLWFFVNRHNRYLLHTYSCYVTPMLLNDANKLFQNVYYICIIIHCHITSLLNLSASQALRSYRVEVMTACCPRQPTPTYDTAQGMRHQQPRCHKAPCGSEAMCGIPTRVSLSVQSANFFLLLFRAAAVFCCVIWWVGVRIFSSVYSNHFPNPNCKLTLTVTPY